MARIISILSASGGIGTSFASCNIASELKKNGASVLLVELSTSAPSHDIILGTSPSVHFNVSDIVNEKCTLSEAVTLASEDDIPDFISASPVYVGGGSYKKLFCSASREYDYMIIDLKSADSVGFAETVSLSDIVLLISDDSSLSVRNTSLLRKSVKMISKAEVFLILNKVILSDSGAYIEDILDEVSALVIGIIPYDEYAKESISNGDLISRYDSYAGRAFSNIAKRIQGESVPSFETGMAVSRFKKNKFEKKQINS